MPRKKKDMPLPPPAAVVMETDTTTAPITTPKKKRTLTTYNKFVMNHYSDADVQKLPVRERLKLIGKLWQQHKNIS